MYRLNVFKVVPLVEHHRFQYIICIGWTPWGRRPPLICCISIHHMYRLNAKTNFFGVCASDFNTSYVSVEHYHVGYIIAWLQDFNTSYVSVEHNVNADGTEKERFQYIICIGWTINKAIAVTQAANFNTSYVSVEPISTGSSKCSNAFQYIICIGWTSSNSHSSRRSSLISIHHMYRLNWRINSKRSLRKFYLNTSYVSVEPSIAFYNIVYTTSFQYIICIGWTRYNRIASAGVIEFQYIICIGWTFEWSVALCLDCISIHHMYRLNKIYFCTA